MQAIADTAALTEAYLRERAGYARRGLADKVAEVDGELARLGYTSPPQEGPQRTAEDPAAPSARKRAPKRTAEEA